MEPQIKINEVKFYRAVNGQIAISSNVDVTHNSQTVTYTLDDLLEPARIFKLVSALRGHIIKGVKRKIKLEAL